MTRLAGSALPFANQTFRFRMIGSFLVSGQFSPPEVLPLRRSSLLFWWVAFYQKPKGYWVYWIEDVYLKLLFLSVAKLEIFRLYFIIQSACLLMGTSLIEITTPPLSKKKKEKKKKNRLGPCHSRPRVLSMTTISAVWTLCIVWATLSLWGPAVYKRGGES